MKRPPPHVAMSQDRLARWYRREAAIEQITEAFHNEGFVGSWEHIAGLVFQEMRKHRGWEIAQEILPWLKQHYGEEAAARMLPEIEIIAGDDEARRIFGLFAPLKVEKRKIIIEAALRERFRLMKEQNKSQLVREKIEENKRKPRKMQRELSGTVFYALDKLIRKVLSDGRKPKLKIVK